jgi:hypothetical protein
MATRYCRVPALVACMVLLVSACDQQGQTQMGWARAALERNSALEIVATDQQAGTFTVRVKDTGELRVVRADQVIGAPTPTAAASGTITPAAVAGAALAPQQQPSPPADAGAPRSAPPAQAAGPPPDAAAAAATAPSSFAPQNAASVESAPGRVLESGPGYTIKAADGGLNAQAGRGRAGAFTSAALEHRHEPIICQGEHLLHIDNRNLVFDGDAVSAENGCEIHITNSHIRAGGLGISARAANVHVDNSLIEGEQGSIDASEGAQVYVAGSQFHGLSRRLDSATVHDLGGNVWN